MYSQEDLNSAVAAGAISAEAASALRAHVAATKEQVPADAEHFRLITGFNDIFVSIGIVILLLAVAAIGQAIGGAFVDAPNIFSMSVDSTPAQFEEASRLNALNNGLEMVFGALFVAGAAWALAEFFTRKRRMALPSILLLLAFIGGALFTQIGGILALNYENGLGDRVGAVLLAAAGVVTAALAWMHWRRFMVPITIAAGTAALAITAIALILAAIGPESDNAGDIVLALVFVAGLVIFAFAMRWDISDPARETRRSDVAFWLHLLAAPMIAHPVFYFIGVIDGDNIGAGAGLLVVGIYVLFGLVALAIDRRALLVSALAYVLIALTILFREFGAVELNFALTALVIGSALLTLSALWTPIRGAVVKALPEGMRARLPATVPATSAAVA